VAALQNISKTIKHMRHDHHASSSLDGHNRNSRMMAVASEAACGRREGVGHGGRQTQHLVSVAVRIRPIFGHAGEKVAVWAKRPVNGEAQRRVCCNRGYLMEEYDFSRVFGPQDDNCVLFNDLRGASVTSNVFAGVNETIFAYGQTGSGKTHTIFGTRGEDAGLLQLFVRSIFDQAEISTGSTVHVCCYEILGDSLTDLLTPELLLGCGELHEEDIVYDELFIKTQRCRYQIVRVSTVGACLSLLQEARLNRRVGVSSCNAKSSRSHAVVHLFVQNPAMDGNSSSIGALTLVDLAGTEKEHENPSEQGRKSTRLLNTSLSSLNCLLRKLQTGALDESERRQSVLNKCLWEYLRPGCGISMIFCVNPLLRHRAITISTLAMATDSKLIQSLRKAQYVQLPGASQDVQHLAPSMPRSPRRQPVSSARSASAPSTPRDLQGSELLSRGTAPRCTPISRISLNEQTPEICMTPQPGSVCNSVGAPSSLAPSDCSAAALGSTDPFAADREMLHEPLTPEELERITGYDLRSPAAVRSLALQNTKLRRKLGRARAKSQERIVHAERERHVISAHNAELQRESTSLRNLFIRQQQQQLAFWSGPFMEMVAPGSGSSSASLATSTMLPSAASLSKALQANGEAVTANLVGSRSASCGKDLAGLNKPQVEGPSQLPVEGRANESILSIQRERDYWRCVATSLQRELQGIHPPRGLASGSRQCSDLSMSQSQPEAGERPQWSGSDAGSELSVGITGICDTPPQSQVNNLHSACLTSDVCISRSSSGGSSSSSGCIMRGIRCAPWIGFRICARC